MRRLRRVRRLLAIAAFGVALAPAIAVATTATVDSNGRILVEGEPFFPIGIYHVSWIGGRQGNAGQLADIDTIADAGFNVVHPTVDLRSGMGPVLDRAAARGMYVIAEIPWAAATNVINLWKAKPAIIGWLIADDFNAPYNGPPNHPPAELASRRDLVAGLAPEHLTYASGGSYPGFEIHAYAGNVGVMGFQSYPIDGGSSPTEYELEENADDFEYVADELAGTGQSFVANPQSFKWSPGAFPTAIEARNLLYPPLLEGANGILFYTFWGENGLLSKVAPALWSEIETEVVELKTLAPFLLGGVRTELATGNARVHASRWNLQNQIIVAVLNTHRTDAFAVSLDLGTTAHGAAQPLFPSRSENGMTAASGQLGGTVGPLAVHVYVVDASVPGNGSPHASASVTPAVIGVGDAVSFDASVSSDDDGSVIAWEWDFGDGAHGNGATAQHAYGRAGTYFARLTVRDDDGAPATLFAPVAVQVTSLCSPMPLGGCREASRSSFAISETPARRTLKWKWKGPATSHDDLGDPTDQTAYALCVYDAGGSLLSTAALPSAAKWSATAAGGFRLNDRVGAPGGVTRALLKPGADDRASITILAKGAALPDPTLPAALPVTVQALHSGGGPCWSATYVSVQQNTPTRLRLRK